MWNHWNYGFWTSSGFLTNESGGAEGNGGGKQVIFHWMSLFLCSNLIVTLTQMHFGDGIFKHG